MDRENKKLPDSIDWEEKEFEGPKGSLRLLVERSVDPVFLMEGNRFIACNKAALGRLSCPERARVLGLSLCEISPVTQPDGKGSADKERELAAATEAQGCNRFEWVCRTFDGRDVPVEVTATLIPIKGGPITHMAWRTPGGSEEKGKTLRQAEARYRDIFENAVNGIFQTTPDGRFVGVNPALAAMYGFSSPREMLASIEHIEDQYVNPGDRNRLKDFLEKQGFVTKFETELYRKDRSALWVSMSARAVKDDDGHIRYYEGFVEDITQRKVAEEALRRERETFFTILDNDPVGVILSDRKGNYLYVNKEFTNVTGFTREEVPRGLDWLRKAFPDSGKRKAVLDKWQKNSSSEGGEWVDVEFDIICKDGRRKDIEFRSTFLKDYSITVLKDVTKRKEAESALQESEEKFRLLFEKSADAILLLDHDRFIDCNEAALRLMRCLGKDRLIGLRPSDISPRLQPDGSDSLKKAQKTIGVALEEGTYRFEWMLRAFDGEEFLTDVSFTVIPIQGRQIMYTVWRDITNPRRAEDALRRAEEKYRNIFENATEGIFQTTLNGRVISANPAFAELFGYESPEELQSSIQDVAREFYADPARRVELKSILEGVGFVRNFEVECYRKDGQKIWISANMRIVHDADGRVLFYEGTMTNVTERKNIQEDLEQKSRSLEEANAALRVLLKHREQDSHELEEKIVSNVKGLVLPYVERLKEGRSQGDRPIVDIIETNLGEIMSPFIRRMASRYADFTPKEIQIADLIKKGKTTKEMSQILMLSTRTIDIHRYNIRRKLNLNRRKVNLQSFLLSLS